MKIDTVHWKFLGIEYARDGEISVLKIFGTTVYASVGNSISIFGWNIK